MRSRGSFTVASSSAMPTSARGRLYYVYLKSSRRVFLYACSSAARLLVTARRQNSSSTPMPCTVPADNALMEQLVRTAGFACAVMSYETFPEIFDIDVHAPPTWP